MLYQHLSIDGDVHDFTEEDDGDAVLFWMETLLPIPGETVVADGVPISFYSERGWVPADVFDGDALRVCRLEVRANDILDEAIETYFHKDGRKLAAECILYSGGDDSTVLAHLFRHRADHAVHINTGIGIEETREFVRTTCRLWGLPLIEESGESYRDLVLAHGFPGPAHHWKMYQRLKERGLRKVRRQLVKNPRRERVLFIAGRRRDESSRRNAVPFHEREGSTVWVSPLAEWTKADLNAYRRVHPDVPRNPVSANLHMSGECLCGAFAKPDELDQIGFFYPNVAAEIRALEGAVRAAGHPEARCQWGWGADLKVKRAEAAARLGPLCHQCTLFDMEES
jgi:3'-phosphoadenosine 5'-phosphosulfate sulfotransferase (PAPS reductase)/FAD synthetase